LATIALTGSLYQMPFVVMDGHSGWPKAGPGWPGMTVESLLQEAGKLR